MYVLGLWHVKFPVGRFCPKTLSGFFCLFVSYRVVARKGSEKRREGREMVWEGGKKEGRELSTAGEGVQVKKGEKVLLGKDRERLERGQERENRLDRGRMM